MSSIAAPARAQNYQWAADNIDASFSDPSRALTAISYLVGLGFSIGAILKFKAHKDNPDSGPIRNSLNDAMSCTVFAGEGTLLAEDSCVWTKITVGRDRSDGANDESVNGRIGGQVRISPGWFLGGALGVGGSGLQTPGGVYQSGRSFDATLVLKRIDGPLFLAAALGASTSSEQYGLSGNGSAYIPGASSNFMADLRLRGAYEFPFNGWYLRPRTDVDIGHARNSGLQVVSPTGTLTIDGASRTTVMFTPALEVGGRLDVGPARILRPYVVVGATIPTDTGTTISGNFNGFYFTGTSFGPSVVARAEAGLQLYEVKGWEMKMEYLISATDSFLGQSFGMRAARHF